MIVLPNPCLNREVYSTYLPHPVAPSPPARRGDISRRPGAGPWRLGHPWATRSPPLAAGARGRKRQCLTASLPHERAWWCRAPPPAPPRAPTTPTNPRHAPRRTRRAKRRALHVLTSSDLLTYSAGGPIVARSVCLHCTLPVTPRHSARTRARPSPRRRPRRPHRRPRRPRRPRHRPSRPRRRPHHPLPPLSLRGAAARRRAPAALRASRRGC